MKKILAVVTALAIAISSLCVFVFATESDNIISSSTMYSGYYNDYTMGADGTSFSATSGGSQIGLTLGTTVGDGESITLKVTGTTDGEFRMWLLSGGSRVSSVYLASDQEGYTTSGTFEFKVTMTVDGGDSGGTSGNAVMFKGPAGGNLPNLTVTSVTIVTEDQSAGTTTNVLAEQTSTGTLTILNGVDFTDDELYLYVNYTLDDDTKAGYGAGALCNSSWTGIESISVDSTGVFSISLVDLAAAFDAAGASVSDGVILNWWANSDYATLVSAQLVRISASAGQVTTLPTGTGLIYVNEEYHALVIQRQVGSTTRRFFVSIPHEDENHDGYCDTCKEYIGTDDEEEEIETVTIDDVEYAVAYSYEDGISSDNWAQVDLGDLELIDALSEEGAILVITRDTETTVSFADGEYEKFLLIDSWWSNDQQPVSLGTAGHTSADEDVIDCTSDDGTVAIYDGAAIYEAWEDGGYAEGGSSLVFISNTSASYKIVSVQVLVPVE